jgi:selenocysteine lyase/cysteine desulfurase
MTQKYPNLKVLFIGKHMKNRLPIICISIDKCDFNNIVKLMNSLYGIQTRGGISCCGLLANYVENVMNIHGWCRITFHWLMTLEEIDYILNAIEYITQNYYKYPSSP